MPNTSRYFIGILAPELIAQEIKDFQKYFADKYKSKAALRAPPHLTIIPPFHLAHEREQSLISFIKNFASSRGGFEIGIQGFGSFGVSVIYAALQKNSELDTIEKELALALRKRFEITKGNNAFAFHPHVTLAFKDLTPPMFYQSKEEFSKKLYKRKWEVSGISVLRYSKEGWKVVHVSSLNSGESELMLDL